MTVVPTPQATCAGLPPGLGENLAAAALALARRVHSAGRLWCAATRGPHSAQRIAAELMQPRSAGIPALPAVPLPSHELVAAARAGARSGDVLLVVAPADDSEVRDLLRRAPAWGAVTLWIGAGARPEPGAADHVLWLPDDEPGVPSAGLLGVCGRLRELVHLRLGDPGALLPAADCDGPVCITCSDEGRLAEVVDATGPTAQVRTPGGLEEVDLSLVGPVRRDELVVVHAGMAITRLTARA